MTGFVMVPGWLLARGVTPIALAVYVHLAAHGTWNPGTARYDECRPAIATLAAEAGISENSVRKGLRELLDLGALQAGGKRYDATGGQLPTVYRVIFGEVVAPGGFTSCTPPVHEVKGGGSPPAPNQEPSTKNPHQDSSDATAPNGGTILKDWIDYLSAQGVRTLPGQTKARYGKELKQALADGFEVRLIKHALNLLFQRGKVHNPQLLPSLLIEVQSARSVSGPPAAKPYVQLADEYKAGKAQVEKAYLELAQQLIDGGMPATEAVKVARQQVHERLAAGVSLETCTSSPYIDGVILDEEPKEVEGS